MKKPRRMSKPTEEELDAVSVSDEEEAEHLREVARVAHALEKARIPPTLDWAIVLLLWSAMAFSVQGMERDYFVYGASTMWKGWEADAKQTPMPMALSDIDFDRIQPQINRLATALRRANLSPTEGGLLFILVSLAATTFARMGLSEAKFLEAVELAFDNAEERLRAVAKQKGFTS